MVNRESSFIERTRWKKPSECSHGQQRRLAEAEKENWHKRSVHANLQNVTRNLERAKRRLRISRPGVRVPSIAPKNAVRPKGLAAFFVCSARAGMLAWQRRRILHALARQKAKRLADGAIGASAGLLFVHLRVYFAQKGPSGRPAGAAQRGAGGRKGTLDSGGGG